MIAVSAGSACSAETRRSRMPALKKCSESNCVEISFSFAQLSTIVQFCFGSDQCGLLEENVVALRSAIDQNQNR